MKTRENLAQPGKGKPVTWHLRTSSGRFQIRATFLEILAILKALGCRQPGRPHAG